MTYSDLAKVISNADFKRFVELAAVKTATMIKGESSTLSVEKQTKRWAKADNVLSGNINYSSWYMAVATNFNNDAMLQPFLTTNTGAMVTNFDITLESVVSAIWNDMAGINETD